MNNQKTKTKKGKSVKGNNDRSKNSDSKNRVSLFIKTKVIFEHMCRCTQPNFKDTVCNKLKTQITRVERWSKKQMLTQKYILADSK